MTNREIAFCVALLLPVYASAADAIRPVFTSEASAVESVSYLAGFGKGPFENTADFNKRICLETHEALKVKPGAIVDFPLFFTFTKYDADRKEFAVDASRTSPSMYGATLQRTVGFSIASDIQSGPAYVGTNAFGVRKDISTSKGEKVALLLPIRESRTSFSPLSVRIPASPEEAKKLSDGFRIIITTALASPCFVTGTYTVRPTIDEPDHSTTRLLGIVGTSSATWKVINFRTGAVLKSGKF